MADDSADQPGNQERAGDGNRTRMTSLEGSVRLTRKIPAKAMKYKGFDGSLSGARRGSGRNLGRKPELRRNRGD
jgi:hypothetical protein